MAQTNKKAQQSGIQPATSARRPSPRWQRERRRQRQIVILSAVTVGLGLIAILGGLAYEQFWLPSRPVARVNSAVLSRSDYWAERRYEITRTIGQSLYLATFGEQFAQQFLGQIGQLDAEVGLIRNAPINDTTINQWSDLQIIAQGATQLGIEPDAGTVAQEMVAIYGEAFAPDPNAPLPTPIIAPTATLTPTATAEVAGTPAPTATPEPSLTPTATSTPTATPLAVAAQSREEQIVTRLYDDYVAEMNRIDPQRRPRLTLDDFRIAIREQFRRQALVRLVQEQLVSDASFTPVSDPASIETRQIMLKVEVPETATEQEREAAFAARRSDAEALVAEIRGGADFATLARERSEDYNSRDAGGEMPAFDADGQSVTGEQIEPAYLQAALALEPGQVSDLVRTSFGWHVIELVAKRVDSREDQLQRARSEAFEAWLTEQRARIPVERFPTVEPTPSLEPTGTAAPLPTRDLAADPTPTLPPTPSPIPVPGETPLPTATLTPGG
ncbi:MAG TPA: peptidylprolyl isomerase [Roseiflexaceae bacterium]|nr:peptidylprolyl isomerase [Roseiflexaceae bacterium]